MDRPEFPPDGILANYSASQMTKKLEEVRAWYKEPTVIDALHVAASETKNFLTDNQHSVNENGRLDHGRWWDPKPDPEVWSFAAIELRGLRMRQLALAYGLARYLGLLDQRGVLPKGSTKYIDNATNLISLEIHLRLMEEAIENRDPSLHLEKLKTNLYLLSSETNAGEIYPEVTASGLLGLWNATKKPGRMWEVRIGPVAKTFHLEAYTPAIEKLKENAILRQPA